MAVWDEANDVSNSPSVEAAIERSLSVQEAGRRARMSARWFGFLCFVGGFIVAWFAKQ